MELDHTIARHQQIFKWAEIKLSEAAFGLSLLSIFLPVKIYPLIFLVSAFLFYRDTEKLLFKNWILCLSVFGIYALISFLVVFEGEMHLLTNIVKMLVNFVFLFFAVSWLRQRDNWVLLVLVDYVLHLIFLLAFVQLITYHAALDFGLLSGSSSSGQASALYNKAFYFWGLEDKNMFGARIALLGFAYILIPVVRFNKLSYGRVAAVFLLAFLSLSRTPVVALLIGVFFLVWLCSRARWRIIAVFVLGLVLPFILQKVIRVEHLTASNDGMGIRLVYWKAFINHFNDISPLGEGFMKAPEFLTQYADFYRGEPHIHNTFMTAYLELGIVGLVSYGLFLVYYFLDCKRMMPDNKFWIMVFLPLLSIMMILYSGYDNDIVMYLSLIFLLGSIKIIDFKTIRMAL